MLFNGQNFKRWQQKMFFYLTTLNLAWFLKETAPQESLVRKYKTEDACTKKFMVAPFLDYKMVDSKNVISHVQYLQSNSKGKGKDKKKNDKKRKGKAEYLAPKAGIVKQKFQGTCYNCDQPGHRAASCKIPKRATP
ncbi:zinc finger, CCHC-type containing protein [Tanacetum coccineum]